MKPPPQFDKTQVRRSFERAAHSYHEAAVLQHEVCRRMDERLDLIKHQPAMVLDAGSGTGNALPALRALRELSFQLISNVTNTIAVCRFSIVHIRGVDNHLNHSAKISFTASTVKSLGPKPVPPVVKIK